MTAPLTLILASASPRRRELLARLKIPFRVEESGLEETLQAGEKPEESACRLAAAKVEARAYSFETEVVLGADTLVLLGRSLLGKPSGPEEASRMLWTLRGREHLVITGLAVRGPAGLRTTWVATHVTMRPYTRGEVQRYVASGEPLDKAGSYAIQGLGGRLVEAVEGCYNNVIGLPLCAVARLLGQQGLELPREPVCRTPQGALCPRVKTP